MKHKIQLFSSLLICAVVFFAACNQGEKEGKGIQGIQNYTPKAGAAEITGHIPDVGNLTLVLYDQNLKDTIQVVESADGEFAMKLQGINVNEVYYLDIRGLAKGFEVNNLEWRESVPVFLQDKAKLSLHAVPYDGMESLSKLKFSIEGGGAEQEFLNAWNESRRVKQAELDGQVTAEMNAGTNSMTSSSSSSANQQQEFAAINASFIAQAKPLASTLYLVSLANDHRSKIKLYEEIYQQSSEEVKNSKYGIDLANRIYRITDFNETISFKDVLAARDSRLMPFDPQDYTDYKYLVLMFWASWEPGIQNTLTELEQLVPAEKQTEVAVLHFSLDTKMSEWKPVTDQLGLAHSFMLRAEVRQQTIQELYLTDLPRFMVVQTDGKVIENDIPEADLKSVVAAL